MSLLTVIGVGKKRGTAPVVPVIYGDIINDSFNPQIGTYKNVGTATHTVSTGAMLIPAQSPYSLNNYVLLADYDYNLENIGLFATYRMASTAAGSVGYLFEHASVNAGFPKSIYWGAYYCANTDTLLMQVFGTTVNSLYVGAEYACTTSDDITVKGTFAEDKYTFEMYINGVLKDTYVLNYDIYNNPVVGETKVNGGQFRIIPGTVNCTLSNLTVNSQAYKFADLLTIGDSNGAGYFVNDQNDRFQSLLRTLGKKITICSGSGDNTVVVNLCLPSIALFQAKQIFLAIGTNDYAVNPSNWETQYAYEVSTLTVPGTTVVVASLLPRNGYNYSGSKTFIDATYTGTNIIVDLYTHFLDPNQIANPYGINPLWSDDGLHLNSAGAVEYYNLIKTALGW